MGITAQDRIRDMVLKDKVCYDLYYTVSGASGVYTPTAKDSGWVEGMIMGSMTLVSSYCGFDSFPDFSFPGYVSGPNPKETLSGISTATFEVEFNVGRNRWTHQVDITPSGWSGFALWESGQPETSGTSGYWWTSGNVESLNSGSAIAAAIQSGINNCETNVNAVDYWFAKDVVVQFDSNYQDSGEFYRSGDDSYYEGWSGYKWYKVFMPTQGNRTGIRIRPVNEDYGFCYATRLWDNAGGYWTEGSSAIRDLEVVAANLVKREMKANGLPSALKSESITNYSYSLMDTNDWNKLNPADIAVLNRHRTLNV